MKIKKAKKSSGQISAVLLILAVILVIVIIIVFVVIRVRTIKNSNSANNSNNTTEVPKPIHETSIGDVKFIFQKAQDIGNVLRSKDLRYQENLTTTEKYIMVTIGAQDIGKFNILKSSWDVGNIIDSDGRNFVSINDQAYLFLPKPDLCGSLLKPDFEPIPCLKLYEVAKGSNKLKVEVSFMDRNATKKQESFIDLDITQ